MRDRDLYEMVRDAQAFGLARGVPPEAADRLAEVGVEHPDEWILVDVGLWMALLDALKPDD